MPVPQGRPDQHRDVLSLLQEQRFSELRQRHRTEQGRLADRLIDASQGSREAPSDASMQLLLFVRTCSCLSCCRARTRGVRAQQPKLP